ncbi:MAG TPA: prephenate dehydrogenase/arogenate dehydrogenase family protein [Vicinamibacterales bacterium]|nr:prephenate dehydrogenase/arogenate dehydrogenase family protein [Vicinamibacterales bacterium]
MGTIRRLGIVGLGLIGGSVAAAVRAVGDAVFVVGVDRPEVLADARHRGLIDDARVEPTHLSDVDLIVLATPVPVILSLIDDLGRAGMRVPVTDVGSTKRAIMATAARAGIELVGGHPMAGVEASGLAHSRPDLFRGLRWFVVPGQASATSIRLVEQLATLAGATPRETDAETHDRAMAYVSHLPQLVAVALADAAGSAVGSSGLAMAGPAFGDMTRVASSSPELWQGILASNADLVGEAISRLRVCLDGLDADRQDPPALVRTFARAAAFRDVARRMVE